MADINWTELFTGAISGIRVNDTYEPMFGNSGLAFRELVYQYMGSQAAQVFEELIDEASGGKYEGDNWELIADGYFQMLTGTINALEEILDKAEDNPGFSKKKILEAVREVYRDLYQNV